MDQKKQEKTVFNLPTKYIFIIIVFGIVFVSFSVIFFKGNILNNYKTETENSKNSKNSEKILSESDKLLQENLEAINSIEFSDLDKLRTIDENDHLLGDLDAKIKIIYYNDLSTPFNEDFFDILDKIRKEFKDASIAYRHFIMSFSVIGIDTALAAECAAEQGKFWEIAERIIEEKEKQQVNHKLFLDLAGEFDMNVDDFETCLDEERYTDKIQAQIEEAEKFGVSGVPTIFVNDIILPGAYPFEDFVDSAERERKGLKTIIEEELSSINN